MVRYLELNDLAKEEILKADEFDFDIFKLRKYTNGNELVSILPFLIARRGLMGATEVSVPRLLSYIKFI